MSILSQVASQQYFMECFSFNAQADPRSLQHHRVNSNTMSDLPDQLRPRSKSIDQCKSNCSRVKKTTGSYSFQIDGYSGLPCRVGQSTESPEFFLCGHWWQLRLFPGGSLESHKGFLSYYLASKSDTAARASYTLAIQSGIPGIPHESFSSSCIRVFEPKGVQIDGWGRDKFISSKLLLDPECGFSMNDVVNFKVDVTVFGELEIHLKPSFTLQDGAACIQRQSQSNKSTTIGNLGNGGSGGGVTGCASNMQRSNSNGLPNNSSNVICNSETAHGSMPSSSNAQYMLTAANTNRPSLDFGCASLEQGLLSMLYDKDTADVEIVVVLPFLLTAGSPPPPPVVLGAEVTANGKGQYTTFAGQFAAHHQQRKHSKYLTPSSQTVFDIDENSDSNITSPTHRYEAAPTAAATAAATLTTTTTYRIPAHRCLLSSRSPVFHSMFHSHMMEQNRGELVITDFEPAVVEEMLYFIYTDKCSSHDTVRAHCQDLMAIGTKYQIAGLVDICETMYMLHIDESTVVDTLLVASVYNAYDLRSECLKYISQHAPAVMQGFDYNHLINDELRDMVNAAVAAADKRKSLCAGVGGSSSGGSGGGRNEHGHNTRGATVFERRSMQNCVIS